MPWDAPVMTATFRWVLMMLIPQRCGGSARTVEESGGSDSPQSRPASWISESLLFGRHPSTPRGNRPFDRQPRMLHQTGEMRAQARKREVHEGADLRHGKTAIRRHEMDGNGRRFRFGKHDAQQSLIDLP